MRAFIESTLDCYAIQPRNVCGFVKMCAGVCVSEGGVCVGVLLCVDVPVYVIFHRSVCTCA